MSEFVPRFPCPRCNKQHTWKSHLAGKRAKCTCGATITVPTIAPGDAPDDLYDVVETRAPAAVAATPYIAPVAAASPAPLTYHRAAEKEEIERDRFREANLISPGRDIYAPVIILIIGFFGLMGWASHQTEGSTFVMIMVSAIWGLTTVVKTAILIGMAFVYAPQLGIGFGDVKSAILKFAAIILFSDALDAWLWVAMRAGRGNVFSSRMIAISVIVAACAISALCHILFEMDTEETGMFALPMAAASLVIGFLLRLGVLALLEMMFNPTVPAPAPTAPPAVAQAPAPPATGPGTNLFSPDDIPDIKTSSDRVTIRPTAEDRQIAQRIAAGGPMFQDALQWIAKPSVTSKGDLPALINDLSAAGANPIHLELGKLAKPSKLYAKLPDQKSTRASCFRIYRAYVKKWELESAIKDQGQEYMKIELKQ